MLISATAEDLCLDYVNTLSWRGSASPKDALRDFSDVVGWAERAGAIDAPTAQRLRSWARDHQGQAARLFAEAIAVREVLYRVLGALAAGEPVRDRDFLALRRALARAPARRQLARATGGYRWRVGRLRPAAPHLLAPVLWSAADLLLEPEPRRLRRCANDDCLWLFLDRSKNATRRWCDMAACGNRAKARRHYSRVKAAAPA